MGRHAQEIEAERTYELIKKEKEGSGTCIKAFLRFLFSQLGLFLVVIGVAVGGNTLTNYFEPSVFPNWPKFWLGAFLLIRIETPYEKTLFALKQDQAKKIIEAQNYMAAAFWSYIYDTDTHNFSQNQ